jgi:hypothetical protein
MGHHFVHSNLRVIYVDTSFPDKIFRFVKPNFMLMNLEDEDNDIFRSCPLDYYFIRPQVSDAEKLTLFSYIQMYKIKHKSIKIPEGRVYYHDLNGNVVVKPSNPVVSRYIRLDSIDGEKYFF